MKNFITKAAAIAVLSAGAILAQGQHAQPFNHGGGPGPGDGSNSTNQPDVATVVAHEVSFLTNLLTLTTGQQTQATTIFTAALNSITPIQTTITTARTALATAVKNNDATGITTQSTAIGKAQGQIVAIEAKADAAFYALLTADQKTKLLAADSDFGSDLGPGLHLPGGGH
jgi:Spy/CpxP family protein refolding chaperone